MRALKFYPILFLLISLPLFSCGKFSDKLSTNNNDKSKEIYSSPTVPPLGTEQEHKMSGTNKDATFKQISDVPDVTNRMIIKSGTMSIETEKYDESANQITDYVKKAGGFVTNSSSSVNASGKKQGSITIRINSDKYDQMVKDMNNFGKILNSQINGNDVTSEYIDLQARLTTQGELEKRLLNLLNEKTARLTDVVDVEQKLSNVREEIEKIQGRMKFLKNQTEFSTLTVSIYEPSLMTTSTGGGFFYELGQGFSRGLKGFTEILSGIITLTIALLPILVILAALGYATILIIRKAKARKIKTV
jgi:hypothetical protein